MLEVQYSLEPQLTAEEFIDLLARSTLAERRPIHDRDCIERMLRNASVISCARVEGKLVGVARTISDFSFCAYLSDLAVDEAFQRRGIGKGLMSHTRAACGEQTALIILAAPKAVSYYASIGLAQHPSCWVVPRGESLPWESP
ncbi:GCN5-related N-acetyltransferase [Pirellula staleyi DSM 6068]|uniref:GCN5-related N-acetyltransferase n=1 Tax=Pirellula staleyi (strain ATCC 27377 / DSM 6068 / ICPB 4128) TaxID=530564 RepID=D2QX20_PIRSD|nr:GNAT family N-acetyltransferase [Pirellula staleyi]ADB16124.1 GCN5-related N-acetyltransferase [Pirellula staleyi DSM 6068]